MGNPIESSLMRQAGSFSPDANAAETGAENNTAADSSKAATSQASTEVTEPEVTTEEGTTTEEGVEETAEGATEEEGAATEEEGEGATADEDGGDKAEATEGQSDYELLLPRDVQEKYPETLMKLAAQHYGMTDEQLKDPKIRALLNNSITRDILDAQAKAEQGATGEDEPADDEPGEDEKGTEGEEKPLTPTEVIAAANEFVEDLITDEGAEAFTQSQQAAWEALEAAIESGDANKIKAARRDIAKSMLSFYSVATMNILPKLLPGLLQKAVPKQFWHGIHNEAADSREMAMRLYSGAREALAKEPRYAQAVKKFTEDGSYGQFIKQHPELLNKQFTDANGKKLAPQENVKALYRYVTDHLLGQKRIPAHELVASGIKAGQKHEKTMERKKTLGKTLTGGRTTGKVGTDKGGSKQFMDRLKTASSADNPLSAFSGKK